MINYGTKLRAIRSEFKLSQAAFAEKLGMKQVAYNMVETNTNGCSMRILEVLFKDFKVSTRWFFLDEGEMFRGTSQQSLIESGHDYKERDRHSAISGWLMAVKNHLLDPDALYNTALSFERLHHNYTRLLLETHMECSDEIKEQLSNLYLINKGFLDMLKTPIQI